MKILKQTQVSKVKSLVLGKYAALAATGIFLFVGGVAVGAGSSDNIQAFFRKPISKDAPTDLSYASVESIYDKLRLGYDGQLDEAKLMDGLKAGLANAAGDPYTEYLNGEESRAFNDDLNGTFTGIGAELGKDENNNIVVIAPIAGFPAEKAGLRAKDVIAEIDGESTVGKSISQAVQKIRGPADSKVKLTLIRNSSEAVSLEITRAEIKMPSVTSEIVDNVGVIKMSRFNNDTSALLNEAAQRFKDAGVKGVVLDLRDNPGGQLHTSVEVASQWLEPNATVLQEKRGGVVNQTFRASGTPLLKGMPTVVLLNSGSASASEIVAGALRDNDAATIMGTKSFGKGSVQGLEPLGDGGVLKLTIARWFTPSGKGIDKQGLEPDQKVERTDEDIKASRDPQREAALNKLK